jgi:hypothetical protein
MSYPPEFLDLVDRFIHLANELADGGQAGDVGAAILFAAGRYNALNFVSTGALMRPGHRPRPSMSRSTARLSCPTW